MRLLLLLCGLTFAFVGRAAETGPLKAGDAMPNLAGFALTGTVPETKGKVVLVDFWASWCGPCKESFPALGRLHEKYKDKGLVIVAIGVDETPAKFEEFLKKQKPAFAIVHDREHKVVPVFKPATMPTSYLIDRKGAVRVVHTGFKGAKTEEEYVKEIEALLAEPAS